jgi:GDP-L-fucose synthase
MDYVFNLIGVKGSPKMCKEQPASFMVPMLQFNTNMMEAARRANVKWYLFTSSVGVYHPADVFKEDDVWKTFPSENDRFAGWAKRIGELQAEAYKIQYGANNISIVRPANVYGPYDNFDVENAMVVPSLIRKAFENTELVVWGDGSPIRDFIYAEDVALGMLYAVENKITEPLNLGSGTGVSIKSLVDIIVDNVDKPVEVKWDTEKPSGDRMRILDMTRAKSYGFVPKYSLEEGVKETIKWFKENREIIDKRHNAFR